MRKSKEVAYIAAFGALAGLIETTLGSFLHAFRVPFSEIILASIFVIILLTARYIIGKPGSTILIGFVTGFIKLFSIGSVILAPLIGIVCEAAITELLITIMGIHRISYIITGGTVILFNFFYMIFAKIFIFGLDFLTVYDSFIKKGSSFFHVPVAATYYILFLLVMLYLLSGIAAGEIGWRVSKRVKASIKQEAV